MKILLPVDGSPFTKHMLSYIAAHDELLGPGHDYTVLTVVSPIPPHATRFLDHGIVEGHYRDEAEKVLQPVRAFSELQHWTFQTKHVVGHAAEAIAAFAEAQKPDLIVMGTHGHSSLVNVVLGSVVSGVLARCKVPMLLIR